VFYTNTLNATQAEIEANSFLNRVVNPGRIKFDPGVAKAWVKFTPAGVISASHNVTSITDTGTGDWTVNFTTALSSANYGANLTLMGDATVRLLVPFVSAQATGSMTVKTVSSADGLANETGLTHMLVTVFGDQA
jgi:hypothetical protein